MAIVALVIYLHPIEVTYRLWRYRHDPDSFNTYLPQLCDRGAGVLPRLYDAFEEHGQRTDVAAFRVAIANTLRCIRRKQGPVTNEDNAYADLPADPRLFATIVRAYNQEPDAERRADMLVFMSELDFRAEFAIFAGMASGPYELPEPHTSVPTVDGYDHERRGIAHDYPAIRAEWCRVVRPVVRAKLDAGINMAHFGRVVDLLSALGRARCGGDDDTALHVRYASSSDSERVYAGVAGLVGMIDSPERAKQVLAPLFSGACAHQSSLYIHLRQSIDPAAAPAIAAAAQPCLADVECFDLDAAACHAHLTAQLARTPN
jgi:hypothetical protein